MKLFIALATLVFGFAALAGCNTSTLTSGTGALVPDSKVEKDNYTLSKDAKNPKEAPTVVFSHKAHSTEKYNKAGDGPIACIECHHTDAPEADVKALGGVYKTAYPADRKTKLTREGLAAEAHDVIDCRGCHAQKGSSPRIKLASYGNENPKVTYEGESEAVTLDSEEAYHRNCNTCHDEVAESGRKLLKGKLPTSQQCTECHTGKTAP